jgi:hypothetical protein
MSDTYQLTGEGYVIRNGETKVPTMDAPGLGPHPETLAYRAWMAAGGVPLPAELPPIEQRRAEVWEAIKTERDRRAAMGVKVGAHWYHSDQKSRTQQLGLVMLGQNIPAGLQWKTLSYSPNPVFVTMTPALAQGIVMSTAASDTAIFTAAEVHRMTMEASAAPQDYNFSAGWPVSIEEEANDAGIQFNSDAA